MSASKVGRRRELSIRAQLDLGILAVLTFVLAASGYLTYERVRQRLEVTMDREMFAALLSVAPDATGELMREALERAGRAPLGDRPFPDPSERVDLVLQAWTPEATVRSAGLANLAAGDLELPRAPEGWPGERYENLSFGNVLARTVDIDGVSHRVVTVRYLPPARVPTELAEGNRPGRPRDLLRERRRAGPDGEGSGPGGQRPFGQGGQRPGEPRQSAPWSNLDGSDGELTSEEAREQALADPSRLIELSLARSREPQLATLSDLRWALLGSWLAATLASAVLLFGLVRHGLAPLRQLGTELASFEPARLPEHVRLERVPAELEPVVDELDTLLARTRAAFAREQAFRSDVAHELRTPLAGLRAQLELALSRERKPDEYRQTATTCLGVVEDLQALVEALFELAQPPEHAPPLELLELEWSEFVEGAFEPYAERAAARDLTFESTADGPAWVTTDPRLLARLLSNLIDNAVDYADSGSAIRVVQSSTATGWSFSVSNAASSARPEDAEHATEAFWRADTARTEGNRHAGIGLTLCQRLVERLDGTLAVGVHDGEFRVSVSLPANA
ncbi:MAG: sensor histidine kinase [Planctomycetota bacterium]